MEEKMQADNVDRGEIRQVFSTTHESIKASGKTMCKVHFFKKLSENEIYCTQCPTALIVNPEVIEEIK